MKEIKLSSGYVFEVEDEVIDDMELVDALASMTSDEDVMAISKVATKLFGDHKKAIYNSFRTKSGRVPTSKIADAIREMFEQLGDNGKK